MDFITILVFMLVMAAVFYQRVTDNIQKKAAKKKTASPHQTFQPVQEKPFVQTEGEYSVPSYISVEEGLKNTSVRKKKERKKRNEMPAERKEQGKEDGNEIHPLPSLKNASEARRAFIYSEIFNRKYD
ncbi:hypothetical protein QUW17_11625 [Bacteroides gallinaceum]|uniref:Uncharacterized protein n=1 Tax=Candidatus Phocaeicola excrementipullorum TaxID=2838731 RepID=A0A948X7Y3_9BACT|nr:hypothetical protein [Bacteroides gallinaceum]MBU3856753.1 hypothetical protein [Candidatus Phocaeicola excrementipullorum]MDM8208526.1 hypothetical protein [Bacteroides gallinaceum]